MTPDQFINRFRVPCFYHFTDTRNLPSIVQRGGIYPWAELNGDVLAPGGNDWSHEADQRNGLDRYVHLCLLNEHPMEYRAKERGAILESRFLRIHPSIVYREGIIFFPDVSNKAGVTGLTLAQAADQMDFEVVYDRTDWRNEEIRGRRQAARKYELLIPGHVPLNMIEGL